MLKLLCAGFITGLVCSTSAVVVLGRAIGVPHIGYVWPVVLIIAAGYLHLSLVSTYCLRSKFFGGLLATLALMLSLGTGTVLVEAISAYGGRGAVDVCAKVLVVLTVLVLPAAVLFLQLVDVPLLHRWSIGGIASRGRSSTPRVGRSARSFTAPWRNLIKAVKGDLEQGRR